MIEFEELYNASEEVYNKEYSHGEYCHEQSFKWGFQEAVKWIEENYIINKFKNNENRN